MGSSDERRPEAVCFALVAVLACAACDKAAPPSSVRFRSMTLDGIGDKRLRITLPGETVDDWGVIPPGFLTYGSIRAGLIAEVSVGILPPQARDCFELSRTRTGCSPRQDTDKGVTMRCVEHDGIALFVELRRAERPLCCLASWHRHAPLTPAQQRIAAGIEAACDTVTPL